MNQVYSLLYASVFDDLIENASKVFAGVYEGILWTKITIHCTVSSLM